MKKKDTKDYADFSNVKNIHDDLIPEEFPDGSLGSPVNTGQPLDNQPIEKKQ